MSIMPARSESPAAPPVRERPMGDDELPILRENNRLDNKMGEAAPEISTSQREDIFKFYIGTPVGKKITFQILLEYKIAYQSWWFEIKNLGCWEKWSFRWRRAGFQNGGTSSSTGRCEQIHPPWIQRALVSYNISQDESRDLEGYARSSCVVVTNYRSQFDWPFHRLFLFREGASAIPRKCRNYHGCD